jgi:AmmeMemoRadiSam system protein B
MLREAIVSGQFYPADKQQLEGFIEACAPKESTKMSARAIILPHAGYVYSGKVAITTVSKILPKKRIIILGNNHTDYGEDFSLWSKGKWKTPLGNITIDEELATLILEKGNLIKEDYLAHKFEHSIEVELPILYYFFKEFSFVPIACQMVDTKSYEEAASQIYEAIRMIKEDILLVASTDLTHYEPDASCRKKDMLAIQDIINLDEESLLGSVRKERISMCGVAPVAVLLCCVKKMGARKAQVALYQTSGDTSGDYSSVVGYVGIIIS